jgi:hypothetical protein
MSHTIYRLRDKHSEWHRDFLTMETAEAAKKNVVSLLGAAFRNAANTTADDFEIVTINYVEEKRNV